MDSTHHVSSDDSEDFSDSSIGVRPNKYHGPTSTWRNLTEEERFLANSLDQERNEDLAAHLYNAHALERRTYDAEKLPYLKPWSSRDQWLRSAQRSKSDDAKGFVPPPTWTAWPLRANLVPREDEQLKGDDEDDGFTLKRKEVGRPSKHLEEVLTGLVLKKANDDFKSAPREHKAPRKNRTADELAESGRSRVTSLAQSGISSHPPSRMSSRAISLNGNELETTENSKSNVEAVMVPVFSADDEQSAHLIRPSVRHSLSKLDSLLMALHDSRQACLKMISDSESCSDEETAKEKEYKTDRVEGRGRPRKKITVPEHILAAEREAARAFAEEQTKEPKKRGRGRPKKVHIPLEGETHEEMFLRVWRQQKKSLKDLQSMSLEASPAPIASAAPSPAPNGVSSPRKRKRSPSNGAVQQKLGLRDWSDVLGTAAIVGFDADVLDRAAKRCATIFGESMSMTTLHETAAASESADTLVQYTPEMISDFESSDEEHVLKRARVHRTAPEEGSEDTEAPYRTKLSQGRHLCPISGCARSENGFSRPRNLSRHLEIVHGLSGEELSTALTDALIDSGDEMDGAVHRDGFLKPLRIRHGEKKLGTEGSRLRSKGKRNEIAREETEPQDSDIESNNDDSQ